MQIAQLHVTKKRDTIAINCIAWKIIDYVLFIKKFYHMH
jgi:hypothetical protein